MEVVLAEEAARVEEVLPAQWVIAGLLALRPSQFTATYASSRWRGNQAVAADVVAVETLTRRLVRANGAVTADVAADMAARRMLRRPRR